MRTHVITIIICAFALCACNEGASDQPGPLALASSEIAFNRGGSIVLIDVATKKETVLVENNTYDRPLHWMAHGDRLIYWNHDGGAWDLWSIDVATKEITNLTRTASDSRSASSSPDGKRIAFQRGSTGLWVMDSDGENQINLSPRGHRDAPPAWSPSGRLLAFGDIESVGEDSQQFVFYIVSDMHTETPVVKRIGLGEPQCFLDEDTLLICGWNEGQRDLISLNIPAKAMTPLTNTVDWDFGPVLSRDGKKIAWAASHDGTSKLMVMNLHDRSPQPLFTTSLQLSEVGFSADGSRIAFESREGRGKHSIFTISVAGGTPEELCGPGCESPVWRWNNP
jgi:Tol biopolymer transport system component